MQGQPFCGQQPNGSGVAGKAEKLDCY
uniref:Uncharacterized protein n=1 Tax=Arundo donax TaxID=35708 RepID=A0A0A9BI20_ARUDO